MPRYQIENTASGLVIGIYEGSTAEDAIRAMHIDAGYKDGLVPPEVEGGETLLARELSADVCPVCREPLPAAHRDRRVSHGGVVTCGKSSCEQRADG